MVVLSAQSELTKRLISGFILAFIVISLAWVGGVAFAFLAAVIAILMYWEWTTITQRSIHIHRDALAVICVLLLVAATYFGQTTTPILISALLMGSGWMVTSVWKKKWGWTVSGIALGSSLATCLVFLRSVQPDGFFLLIFLCFSIWAADTFAYAVGRTVGGPKLMPKVSPKKTWSGFIGGLLGAAIIGGLVASFCFPERVGLFALLAVFIALAAQIGDLVESHIKRLFNVKDSSNLIPGHGGILDRVDGLTLSAYVFVAFYVLGVAH